MALAWGLFYLHGIFVEERDDALAAISARRLALEQYAQKELEQRLKERLDGATRNIDAAERDPLIPAQELWLVDRGVQVLPRTARAQPGHDTPAADLYRELRGPQSAWLAQQAESVDPGSPWAERLAHHEALKAALVGDDREGIENAVRSLLALRASYVISAKREIPLSLAALAELSERSTPARSLMAGLLRDGLQGSGSRIEGLQRTVLLSRARFTEGDMQFFKERIVELARPAGVLHADFASRVD
ncbi:MAG: sensor histidine kinase, partial [Deltaproteobacteria bacterium]